MTGIGGVVRERPRPAAALAGGLALVAVAVVACRGASDQVASPPVADGPTIVAATTSAAPPPPSAVTTSTGAGTTTLVATSPPPAVSIPYELDVDELDPAVAARPLPDEPDDDEPPQATTAPPPWAASTVRTTSGHLRTDVGCADDLTADGLDRFLAGRLGPLLGWDYQHVYGLGGDRYLWLFQDAFIDHTGAVDSLGRARFAHNAALLQTGRCFQLLHGGTASRPEPFEAGDGTGSIRGKWWWPMGGETIDGVLHVFWVEMVKDPYDPAPPDGLGWHPNRTYLATYDPVTLARRSFGPAPDSGAIPIYGYAVASDDTHTYLFGNTFEQNLVREGGFWNGPHSATDMWLARVPRGRLDRRPEYRTETGWSPDRSSAVPIVQRYYVENPMQPRLLDGQWVSATAVDGYWGESLAIDVAPEPWGPWTTVEHRPLSPRGGDPLMNTYHAHPLPWRDGFGSVLVTVSNNARDMRRDAWAHPYRYRPAVTYAAHAPTPTTTSSTSSTSSSTTSTSSTSTTTTSTTSTTVVPPTSSSTTTTTTTSSTTTSSTTTSTTGPSTTTSSTTSSSTSTSTTTTTTTTPTT